MKRPIALLNKIAAAVESDPELDDVIDAATRLYYQASSKNQQVWRSRDEPQFPLDLASPPKWMLALQPD